MGILDDLKHKVEQLGDKAKGGLDAAKDGANDLLDDAKERFGHHEDESSPLGESSDIGPDTSSTDAVQPGYVTAEDDDTEDSDEGSLHDLEADEEADELEDGLDDGADATGSGVPVDVGAPASELDAEELVEDSTVAAADEPQTTTQTVTDQPVETDVDPYDQPLTESIGDEIASALVDREAVAQAVETTSGDQDAQA